MITPSQSKSTPHLASSIFVPFPHTQSRYRGSSSIPARRSRSILSARNLHSWRTQSDHAGSRTSNKNSDRMLPQSVRADTPRYLPKRPTNFGQNHGSTKSFLGVAMLRVRLRRGRGGGGRCDPSRRDWRVLSAFAVAALPASARHVGQRGWPPTEASWAILERVRPSGLRNIEHSTLNVEVVHTESCGLRRFIAALLSVGTRRFDWTPAAPP